MRKLPVVGLLVAVGLLLLACQAPTAQVDSELSNVQATIEQVPEPEATPSEAPTATMAPAEAEATTPAADSSQGDTTASSDAAPNEPDPLSVDPNRPGFTLDGSPTLGAADAPVVVIEFGDFQ